MPRPRPTLARLDAARQVLVEHVTIRTEHGDENRARLIQEKIREIDAEILLRVRRREVEA